MSENRMKQYIGEAIFQPTRTDDLREGKDLIGQQIYVTYGFTLDCEGEDGQVAWSRCDEEGNVIGSWIPERDLVWVRKPEHKHPCQVR